MTKTKTGAKRGGNGTASTSKTRKARNVTAPPPSQAPTSSEGLDGAMQALALALDKKALEPVLLDVRQLCSFCNYQLVISGRSERQVDAIADAIELGLKEEGMRPISTEGARTGQ